MPINIGGSGSIPDMPSTWSNKRRRSYLKWRLRELDKRLSSFWFWRTHPFPEIRDRLVMLDQERKAVRAELKRLSYESRLTGEPC